MIKKKAFLILKILLLRLILLYSLPSYTLSAADIPLFDKVGKRPPAVVIEASIKQDLFPEEYGERNCLDEQCSFFIERARQGGYYISYDKKLENEYEVIGVWINEERDRIHIGSPNVFGLPEETFSFNRKGFPDVLEKITTPNFEEIKPIFYQKIDEWRNNYITGGDYVFSPLRGGDLVFSVHDSAKEKELANRKSKLFLCYYPRYQKIKNWLVYYQSFRNYCNLTLSLSVDVSTYSDISISKFLKYLATNINAFTIPYLATPMGIIVLIGIFLVKGKKSRAKK